ncbi:hypothetical protein KOR42_54660 [Thalassoglobus neptunius]|uniref:Uncharacterized protein n=1 Tax=Thalassoglobus neptunius TaxID=1938619 RepID=A0A5C5UYC3_9PLAN|nr:hypothetical protein KOR42_54660 [Thalassoglobus neptunius]
MRKLLNSHRFAKCFGRFQDLNDAARCCLQIGLEDQAGHQLSLSVFLRADAMRVRIHVLASGPHRQRRDFQPHIRP